MAKKMITGVNILAVICLALFVMAACTKKTVQPSPTPPSDVSVTEDTTTADKEKVLASRVEDLTKQEVPEVSAEDIFSEKIYFEYDRSDLSAEARTILKKIAAALSANPSYSIDIAGHCDERGTIEYNLALGERRARSAKKYLIDIGVSGDRISMVSYGEERPVDPRSTEEAWAKNRRDEFKLIK